MEPILVQVCPLSPAPDPEVSEGWGHQGPSSLSVELLTELSRDLTVFLRQGGRSGSLPSNPGGQVRAARSPPLSRAAGTAALTQPEAGPPVALGKPGTLA